MTLLQENRDEAGATTYQLNIFVMDGTLRSLTKEQLIEKYDQYFKNYIKDAMARDMTWEYNGMK